MFAHMSVHGSLLGSDSVGPKWIVLLKHSSNVKTNRRKLSEDLKIAALENSNFQKFEKLAIQNRSRWTRVRKFIKIHSNNSRAVPT